MVMFNGYFDKLPEGISMGYLYIYIWDMVIYVNQRVNMVLILFFSIFYIATVDGISILWYMRYGLLPSIPWWESTQIWCIEFIPVKGLMRGSIVMRVPIKIAGWWLFPWENLNPKMDDNWYPHDLGNLHIFWAHSKSPRFHSPWMRLQSRIIVVFQNLSLILW